MLNKLLRMTEMSAALAEPDQRAAIFFFFFSISQENATLIGINSAISSKIALYV